MSLTTHQAGSGQEERSVQRRKKKKKERTSLADDHQRRSLIPRPVPPKRRSLPWQRAHVDLFGQSTCCNAQGLIPAGAGRIRFLGTQCAGRWGGVPLGDGAIEEAPSSALAEMYMKSLDLGTINFEVLCLELGERLNSFGFQSPSSKRNARGPVMSWQYTRAVEI